MSTITAQATQVYSVWIKATPEQVWDAITKPEFTGKYFFGSQVDSSFEPGADFRSWSPDREQLWVDGVVEEADPPRRLSHTWRALYNEETAAEEHSRVTWEIEPGESGVTKLTVVHDRLEAAPKTAASVAGGWSLILSSMKSLLETGEALPAQM
ncbi:MAG: SRPBCC family protein [Actinobacteria bacterium]|nr:SRPBCC family protein [Actinomycetota bacterium]